MVFGINTQEAQGIIRKIAVSRTARAGVPDQAGVVADEVIANLQARKAYRDRVGSLRAAYEQHDQPVSQLAKRVIDLSRLAQIGRDRDQRRQRLGLEKCKPMKARR